MRNVSKGTSKSRARIENLLESKIIEADRNLVFSLTFEEELPHISDMCDKISVGYIDDVKRLGRVLLSCGYDPVLNIKGEIRGIDLSSDVSSKGPYSAVSVLKHNYHSLLRMIEYSKRLINEDSIICFDRAIEELNRIILKDIETLTRIKELVSP